MALFAVPIRPGVHKDDTGYSSEGRLVDSDKVRIDRGSLQKIGGWTLYNVETLEGICRGVHSWNSFDGSEFQAFGTHTHLYIGYTGALYDITPAEQQSTNTLTDPFDTTSGSKSVNVSHTGHGRIPGETVYFHGATSVGGITIFGNYAVATVVGVDDYTIVHDSAATSTANGGGTVTYRYFRATLSGPFTTTLGSAAVTVTDTAHGRSANDRVIFDSASAVGGITIDGEYTVTSVTDADNYVITHSAAASSGASGGGTVGYTYLIPVGIETTVATGGYGIGGYGSGAYGTSTVTAALSRARTWSFGDMNGRLYANPRGLSIYEWSPARTNARACPLPNAPAQVYRCFVTPERFVVAAGCTDSTSVFDPLNIRWCSQNDQLTWTPASTNSSKFYRLNEGNAIISAQPGSRENLVWTDLGLYAMRFSVEYVYVFELVATGCGSAGPNAAIERDGLAFWMGGNGNFYRYAGGTPIALPCPVQDYIETSMSVNQEDKVFAFFDTQYSEAWWLIPAGDDNECSIYVSHNYGEESVTDSWMVGTFDRTAWIDRSASKYPIAVDTSGMIYFQEYGTSANGGAMSAYVETAPFDPDDGNRVFNVRRYVPDIDEDGSTTVTVTFKYRRFPNAPLFTKGPYSVTSSTEKVDLRFQARQLAMRFASSGDADRWRLGKQRLDIRTGITR